MVAPALNIQNIDLSMWTEPTGQISHSTHLDLSRLVELPILNIKTAILSGRVDWMGWCYFHRGRKITYHMACSHEYVIATQYVLQNEDITNTIWLQWPLLTEIVSYDYEMQLALQRQIKFNLFLIRAET